MVWFGASMPAIFCQLERQSAGSLHIHTNRKRWYELRKSFLLAHNQASMITKLETEYLNAL